MKQCRCRGEENCYIFSGKVINNQKFYFTYGTGPQQAYKGGWSVIYADSLKDAQAKHRERHGLTKEGLMRYAFDYTEEQFMRSGMVNGNLGASEQEVL